MPIHVRSSFRKLGESLADDFPAGTGAASAGKAASLALAASSEVWPLPLVDPRDAEQVEALFRLMRAVPEVIEHYLDKHVFRRRRGTRA